MSGIKIGKLKPSEILMFGNVSKFKIFVIMGRENCYYFGLMVNFTFIVADFLLFLEKNL